MYEGGAVLLILIVVVGACLIYTKHKKDKEDK